MAVSPCILYYESRRQNTMVYTVEEKLQVIKLYLERGIIRYPEGATARQKENIRKKIRKWVGVYKEKGEEGLAPKRKSYSYKDKKFAIERLLAGESKYQVAFSMGLSDTDTLRKWMNKYRKYGFDAFKEDASQSQRYFDKTLQRKEQLKALEEEVKVLERENKELKAEIEYLKKLIALVQEKGQRTKINASSLEN